MKRIAPIARPRGASRAIAIAENSDREKYIGRDVNKFYNNGADLMKYFCLLVVI